MPANANPEVSVADVTICDGGDAFQVGCVDSSVAVAIARELDAAGGGQGQVVHGPPPVVTGVKHLEANNGRLGAVGRRKFVCEFLVHLVEVFVVLRHGGRVAIETRGIRPSCPSCEVPVVVKDRDTVELTDLPCFGQPATLAWRKVRWECPGGCGSFTEGAPQIAAPRLKLTDRAARWATLQVGCHGRSVSEIAKDLDCGWHAVMESYTRMLWMTGSGEEGGVPFQT